MDELLGCWREAQRADKVSVELIRMRKALGLEFYDPISTILRGIELSSRLLRDLYDLFPIYRARVPIIVYYLNVILPSLCKTLKEMLVYVDNPNLAVRSQWILMGEKMGVLSAGMDLDERHVVYNEFLVQLIRLLGKCVLTVFFCVDRVQCGLSNDDV